MNWKKHVITTDRYLVLTFPEVTQCLITNLSNNCTISLDSSQLSEFRNALGAQTVTPFVAKLLANNLLRFDGQQVVMDKENHLFPSVVYWGLTDRCNLRCRYCYGSFGEHAEQAGLSFEQALVMIGKLKELGARKIHLTGGEASLHPRLFDIAEAIREQDMSCCLLTNAQLINPKNASRYTVFDQVKISLDSHLAEENDACRGKGSYQHVFQAIKLLSQYKLPISIGCVVSRCNYQQIPAFRRWLEEEFSIMDFYPAYLTPVGRGYGKGLDLSNEQISQLENRLFLEEMKDPAERERAVSGQIRKRGCVATRCGMGMSEVFINWAGDVYPCRAVYEPEMKAGNLIKDTAEAIIHQLHHISDQYDVSNLPCRNCNFRFLCSSGCRVYHKAYSGSFKTNSPDICQRSISEICHSLILASDLPYVSGYTNTVISLKADTQ